MDTPLCAIAHDRVAATSGQQSTVALDNGRFDGVLGIAFDHAQPCRRAEGASLGRIGEETGQGAGQGLSVVGRYDQTFDPVAHEIPATRHVGHDQSLARGGRFQQRSRQTLAAA